MSNLPINTGGVVTSDAKFQGYYDGYYSRSVPVTGQQYDVILTFFMKRTNSDKIAAEALTSSVLVLALNRGIDPLSIIDDFKKFNDDLSFKAALVALLNSDRRPTSKLGYAAEPVQDQYVVRNIHG